MESEFLDLKSKARELGLNYLALRARILSNDLQCFVYLAGVDLRSVGTDEWLPAWEREKFPFIHWKDHGALWTSELEPRRDARTQQNRYTVRGFAMLDPYAVDTVLTAGKIEIDRNWVHICDSQYDIVASLVAIAPARSEWIEASPDEYPHGGYERQIPVEITADDLFMPSERPSAPTPNVSFSPEYPEELRAAVEAFQAVSRTFKPGRSPKTALTEWLTKHKPELTSAAVERIATVANWQRQGGAPKTPGVEN